MKGLSDIRDTRQDCREEGGLAVKHHGTNSNA
jgi:hypothetical protein